MNMIRSFLATLGLMDDPWFETGSTREVLVDSIETADGRIFERYRRVAEYVNFNTGAVELRPVGEITEPRVRGA